MSRAPVVVAAAAVGTIAALACGSPTRAGEAGFDAGAARTALARHELRDLDGRSLRLGALRGEVIVVAFWASWCAPCRRELPVLDALHAELSPRGGRVVAISIDQDPENARRFARRLRLALPVYHDGPERLARTLDLKQVPFTMVLDRQGVIARTFAGSDAASLDAIAATARRLLDARPQDAAADAGSGDTP